jgi:hypothetical protein
MDLKYMAVVTSNEIIVNAFNLIAVYSPDDVIESRDLNVGLIELNNILSSFSSDGQLIPFRQTVTFNLVSGQNSYIFSDTIPADVDMPPIIELNECNITFNDVILPCNVVPYSNIVNTSRVENLSAIPGTVYLQKGTDFSQLYFYPAPSALISLMATIYAKFSLSSTRLFEEMLGVPPYYTRFLKYELARALCAIYPSSYWSEAADRVYQDIIKKIRSSSDIDVCIQGDCLLTRSGTDTTQTLLGMLPVAGN